MEKKMLIIILSLFLIPLTQGIALEVEKIDKGSVVISEFNNPAVFDFIITNNGANDLFEIYSLVTPLTASKENFEIPKKITLEVKVYVNDDLRRNLGFLLVAYEIQGKETGIFKDEVLLKIVSLEKIIKITPKPVHPDDVTASIIVNNTEDVSIENLTVEFESPLFKTTKTISLAPKDSEIILAPIDKEKRLETGTYELISKIKTENKEIKLTNNFDYLPKENISEEKSSKGVIIVKTKIKKTNMGNVNAIAEIDVNKDIISRLFTKNAPPADITERKGFYTKYNWQKNLSPGQNLEIETSTNYTIPFLVLLSIILIFVVGKFYFRKPLSLDKKVFLVKTKGGEFALKVKLYLKSKKHIENLHLADTLPKMAKLYDSFGKKPNEVNEQTRKMTWKIGNMNAGETRVISYIVYSKMNIIGRFELPSARASFESEGELCEVWSERAFFVREGV